MTTATLIRLATETSRHLSHAISVESARNMLPSYNAILGEAQAMYPNERFLHVLKPFDPNNDEHISIAELNALFAQIAIVLESLQNEPVTERRRD